MYGMIFLSNLLKHPCICNFWEKLYNVSTPFSFLFFFFLILTVLSLFSYYPEPWSLMFSLYSSRIWCTEQQSVWKSPLKCNKAKKRRLKYLYYNWVPRAKGGGVGGWGGDTGFLGPRAGRRGGNLCIWNILQRFQCFGGLECCGSGVGLHWAIFSPLHSHLFTPVSGCAI